MNFRCVQLVFKASTVQSNLEKLGCFRDVSIIIDVSDVSPDGYEVSKCFVVDC